MDLSRKEEKKVEYLELIYDLIFVYIIGRNNSLLHHTADGLIRPGMFAAYVLCTLAVIQIWNFSTFYINIHGKNGLREHIFLFTNMFLLYFIAEGTREHWEGYHAQYHAAWALILLNIAVQYIFEVRDKSASPAMRDMSRRVTAVLLAEAVCAALMIPIYKLTGWDFSYVPILVGILGTFWDRKLSCPEAINFAHLTERAMLYVVFTFGEMVIAIAGYFEGELDPTNIYFSLMAFLIVAGLFLSYGTVYDHIIDREKKDNGLVFMLIHIFIIFALNSLTTALEFMREEEIKLTPKLTMLIVSFIMFYTALFLIMRWSKSGCRPERSFYVKMALTALSFVGLMFLFRNNMYVNIGLTVAYVFGVYALIYRIGSINKAVAREE